jgi:hypothetical protein
MTAEIRVIEYYPYSDMVRLQFATKKGPRVETATLKALQRLEDLSDPQYSETEQIMRDMFKKMGGMKWLKEEILKIQQKALEERDQIL